MEIFTVRLFRSLGKGLVSPTKYVGAEQGSPGRGFEQMTDRKQYRAASPWRLLLSSWKKVLLGTWKEQSEDNISLAAAGVAFYGLLALVPLLGAIVLTYGLAADPQTVLHNMKSLTAVLPADVAKLIGEQLMSLVQSNGSKKGLGLLVALAVALWGARNAATSVITAINMAYEVKETRSTVRVNLLALALTAGGVAMAVLALLAITALGYLQKLLPHMSGVFVVAGKCLSYFALLLGAAAGAASLYRFAPSRDDARWQWITPGSLMSASLWLGLTFGFGFYVAHFGNYDKTYGTLATIVILVTWMYLSANVFLLGAELNSQLEKLTLGDDRPKPSAIGTNGPSFNDREGGLSAAAPRAMRHAGGKSEVLAADPSPSIARDIAVSRMTSAAGRAAGLARIGIASTVLSTFGLALLRKRGREGAGAALVAGAVGLSLLKRRG